MRLFKMCPIYPNSNEGEAIVKANTSSEAIQIMKGISDFEWVILFEISEDFNGILMLNIDK
jgi:hypothetical protein